MKHVESRLQIACVAWFRAQYASIWNLLFSVPNGGARSKTEGAILKAEGATRGVADLLLLVARGGFGALAIEMKTTSKNPTNPTNKSIGKQPRPKPATNTSSFGRWRNFNRRSTPICHNRRRTPNGKTRICFASPFPDEWNSTNSSEIIHYQTTNKNKSL